MTQLTRNITSRHNALFLIPTLFVGLLSAVSAAEPSEGAYELGPKFFDLVARDNLMQTNNDERAAIIWEVDGEAFCSNTPPASSPIGFQFSDFRRWNRSATNAGPLNQGDPMVLTYGFMDDGTAGGGFSCGVAGETAGAPSDLIAFLDRIQGAGPGGADLTLRPWFAVFKSAFDNWGVLNGVQYVYEPNDDGANAGQGGASGVRGVRADLRIGGHFIDGQVGSNVLACNYFPSNGDMIIDTGNSSFYAASAQNRRFRNVLEHEHGHGMGISHVCPRSQTKLMEPFISTRFLGAQEDDILAANRGYGDRDEFPAQNDTSSTATALGTIAIGASLTRSQVSIDDNGDQDYYSFVAPIGAQASITVTPRGSTYLSGPQNSDGSCSAGSNFNSLLASNLGFDLLGKSGGNLLASANSVPAGITEQTLNTPLNEGQGTYFVRVFGAQNAAQMYDLTIQLSQGSIPPTPSDDVTCSVIVTSSGSVVPVCL